MKKNTKHRFTHPDPEKTTEVISTKDGHKAKIIKADKNTLTIKKDLKRVSFTIIASILLLALFYFLNQKYNLLEVFSSKF